MRLIYFWSILLWTIGMGCSSLAAQKLIPYLDGDLYGFADSLGTVIIQPQFDKVSFFGGPMSWDGNSELDLGMSYTESLALVKKERLYNIIDQKGDLFLKEWCKRNIRLTQLNDSISSISVGSDNKYGFYLVNKDRFTGFVYNAYREYRPEPKETGVFAPARIDDGKNDIYNMAGELIHPNVEQVIILDESGYVWKDENGVFHFCDSGGIERNAQALETVMVENGFLIVSRKNENGRSLYAIYDRQVGEILPFVFHTLPNTTDNFIIGMDSKPNKPKPILTWYLYDINGKLLQKSHDNIARGYGGQVIVKNGKNVKVLDRNGEVAFSGVYDTFRKGGLELYLYRKDTSLGLIDTTGKMVVSGQKYDYITKPTYLYSPKDLDFYISKKDGLNGIINKEGKEILPTIFKQCYKVQDDHVIVETTTGHEGVFSTTGDMIIDTIYDRIDYPSASNDRSHFIVEQNSLYACFDLKGIQLSEFSQRRMRLGQRMWRKRIGDCEFQLVGKYNNILSDEIYDTIRTENFRIRDTTYTACIKASTETVDIFSENEELKWSGISYSEYQALMNPTPPLSDFGGMEILSESEGNFLARSLENNNYGIVDKNGNWVVKPDFDRSTGQFIDDEVWLSKIDKNGNRVSVIAYSDGELEAEGYYDRIIIVEDEYLAEKAGQLYHLKWNSETKSCDDIPLEIIETDLGFSFYKVVEKMPNFYLENGIVTVNEVQDKTYGDSELLALYKLDDKTLLVTIKDMLHVLSPSGEILKSFEIDEGTEGYNYSGIVMKDTPWLRIIHNGKASLFDYKRDIHYKK